VVGTDCPPAASPSGAVSPRLLSDDATAGSGDSTASLIEPGAGSGLDAAASSEDAAPPNSLSPSLP